MPAIVHVSCAPLKFRTLGFPQYGFKCGFGCDLHHKIHRLNPPQIYPAPCGLYTPSGYPLASSQCVPLPGSRQSGPLSLWITTHHPEALRSDRVMLSLPSSLIRPHPPVWTALPDFPAAYTESSCHSGGILAAAQTFPTFTTRHCMITTCSTPGAPITAYPICFIIGSSHHPLTTGVTTPAEHNDASTTCSLSLRPSYLLTPLNGAFTSDLSSGRSSSPDVGYNYRAEMGIALAGLSPACLVVL